ncbi:MAG: arginase family protein [Bacteroidia bacterium]|nr:arginase family protein [Bacteroidia bacterium]
MSVQIVTVPYASGRPDFRTGRGPGHLVRHGFAQSLRDAGVPVGTLQSIGLPPDRDTEVESLFALHERLSYAVRTVVSQGDFPLILAGNCSSTVGAVSGLDKDGLGVLWFDAHGDYNTPETTATGYLDGMALSILTGQCWRRMAENIKGFEPIDEDRILHLGGRHFDDEENILIHRSNLYLLLNEDLRTQGIAPLLRDGLRSLRDAGVERVHLHFDLDVLDPTEAPANFHENSAGLSVAGALEAITLVRQYFPLASAAFTAYDPAYDPENSTVEAAKRLARALFLPVESSGTDSQA